MPMAKKPRSRCLSCERETKRAGYKYCDNGCQSDHKYTLYVVSWLQGNESGGKKCGTVSNHVRRFLISKFGEKCSLCAWCEVNPHTGKIPLEVDHINGDWQNNTLENLRLLCPNCHSLTPTYKALNKGKGRDWRKQLYHTMSKSSD
ncbi:HNH endonuclease [Trichocoleus sp. FACHB-90]|nr:HNH endonuclease [Trichocoleus sp. FACHB-90]